MWLLGKVIELFQSDPRWSSLEDELEREELFEEYSLSLERKEATDRLGERLSVILANPRHHVHPHLDPHRNPDTIPPVQHLDGMK